MDAFISSLTLAVLLSACAVIGNQGPATAQDLFENFVVAAYGEAGMAGHKSITTSGNLIVENFGLEGPVTTKQMAPNFLVMENELMGSMTQGCNANVCWSQQPGQSPRPAQSGERDLLLQQADFYQWENMDEHYATLEVVPVTEETSYHKVRAVRDNGVEDYYYFSKENDLLIGAELTVDTVQGVIKMTSRFNKYKEFDSILLPTEIIQQNPVVTAKMVVKDISFTPLTESDFAAPDGL